LKTSALAGFKGWSSGGEGRREKGEGGNRKREGRAERGREG